MVSVGFEPTTSRLQARFQQTAGGSMNYGIKLVRVIHCLKRQHLSIEALVQKCLSEVIGLYHTLRQY